MTRSNAAAGRPVPLARIDSAKIIRLMLAFFGDSEVPLARTIGAGSIPAPYRRLLAHNSHMTQELARHFGGPVSVRPTASAASVKSMAGASICMRQDSTAR